MARRRMIDPAIWTDEKFGTLSLLAKLLFIGLVSNADDEGRGNASPIFIKAVVLPYDFDTTPEMVKSCCVEIANKMNIVFYKEEQSQKLYYQIVKFNDWQTINRPSPSKIPSFDDSVMTRQFNEYSMNTHTQLTPKLKEVKLKEVNISKENISKENTRESRTDGASVFEERFEVFWKAYNFHKGSKSKAKQWFITHKVSDETLKSMLEAIKIDDVARDEAQIMSEFYPIKPFATTWLNQKRWETLLENVPQSHPQGTKGNLRENIPPQDQSLPTSQAISEIDDIDKIIADYEASKKGK